jgi:hypothetical protein
MGLSDSIVPNRYGDLVGWVFGIAIHILLRINAILVFHHEAIVRKSVL